jgi:xanthine dehydrogenase accessory factor
MVMLSAAKHLKAKHRETRRLLVLIKGGGDLGTGVAYRLHRAGMQVVVTELAQPTVVRRAVSLAETVYEGEVAVEDLHARLVPDAEAARLALAASLVPVLVDPQASITNELRPHVVVDARMAKRNLGTRLNEADLIVGLGPGFVAGQDVHAVIETARGHYLGRVLWSGEAAPDTGIPGSVGGESARRVLRAPVDGVFRALKEIGDPISKGERVAQVDDQPIVALLPGVLRGILRDGLAVQRGMKVGDIDPRGVRDYCFTISEKALAVGGGVLEAILHFLSAR